MESIGVTKACNGGADNARGRHLAAGTSDAELIAALRETGGEALGPLFRRYARLVYRVALDILRDTGEAEDVVQEVFLEVYRKGHLYDPARGSVKVWLVRCAFHRALRHKAALCRRAAYRSEPLEAADAPVEADQPLLTREECRWILRSGLAKLPERQRMTVELACLKELSLREVADRMRVSLGCARHYYYRGLAGLRAWAGPSGLGPPWRSTRTVVQSRRR